ncbi:nicotinamide phosphoribosyl transferase [Staphylococcus phage vB_Sau_Clo6]|nr:nicotinamide phosphoribosyl transferase [Staphylococcus phage vB_Sau_Clo6]
MLNPTLMCDFYKLSHREQYPEGTEIVYSTLVPRSNKYYEHSDNIVVFGIQSLVKKYFIDMFNREFFNRPKKEVINEYKRTVKFTLGHENPDAKHLEQLHDLGYLPIDVRALKEGTVVHPNTPVMTIENTHSDFFWLTNYLETIISTQTWQAMTSATLAYDMRKMLDKYALETVGNIEAVDFQGHDFSMRGMSSLETAQLSSAGHAISFKGSDTVPVVEFLESYYNADVEKEIVVASIPATEHSVMCANGDYETMDEYETYKRMLTEIYPTGVFSIVSDTWDFWGNMTKTLPRLKDIIMERDGKVVIRPDCYDEETEVYTNNGWKYFKDLSKDDLVAQVLDNEEYEFTKPLKYVNEYYKGNMHHFKDHYGKVDLLVTPNHRMILEQNDKEKVVFAEDMKEKGNYSQKMARSAKAKETGKILTPIEKLKIAFQADGSFVTKQPNNIRFSFSKQRKMERLEDIISQCNLEVRAYNLSDDSVEYHIKVPNEEFKKDFSWVDTENLSYQWCIDFIEELSYWDSTRRSDNRFKFDTTVKEVADVVFDIGLSAGYGVYKVESADDRKEHFSDIHTLHIMKDNKVGGQSWTNTTEEYEGNIYCVQVPTGRLLVKRNKCTMVCGNSGDPVKIICGDPDADTEHERKGAVEVLWDTFGGTETEKGYKVLDEHVGLIYGDSINYERAQQICEGLKEKGFASINVVLGVGSFSYQFNTRDTHGFAIKATYAKIKNEEKLIYKNPKTDSGKRSHKGRVAVYKDGSWEDNLNLHQWLNKQNLNQLERVFEDGKLYRDQSLSEIREIIKNN